MSGLPKQVVAAGKRSDDAIEAMNKAKQGPDGAIVAPVDTPPTEKQPDEAKPVVKDNAAAPPGNVLNWETEYQSLLTENNLLQSRYDSLQGKYNAEVPRLQQEIQALKAGKPADTNGAPDEGQAAPDAGTGNDIPAEFAEMFGTEFVDFLKKRDATAQAKIDNLTQQVTDIGTTAKDNERNSFFDAIAAAHSDWQAIDRTKAFINFLTEQVPEVGMTRQEIVDRAVGRGDPQPVITQISTFKERANTGSAKSSKALPPDGGGGATPVDDSNVRFNESTIKAFYQAASRGKYSGKPDEYARLEALYTKAAMEGRVNQGK